MTKTATQIHSYTAEGRIITAEMRAAAAVIPSPTLEQRKAQALADLKAGRI